MADPPGGVRNPHGLGYFEGSSGVARLWGWDAQIAETLLVKGVDVFGLQAVKTQHVSIVDVDREVGVGDVGGLAAQKQAQH